MNIIDFDTLLLDVMDCVQFFLNVKVKSKVTTKRTTTTRVKKVFSLAGQKYDPPEEVVQP